MMRSVHIVSLLSISLLSGATHAAPYCESFKSWNPKNASGAQAKCIDTWLAAFKRDPCKELTACPGTDGKPWGCEGPCKQLSCTLRPRKCHPDMMVIFDFDGTLQNNYLSETSHCPSEDDIIYNAMKQMYLLSLPFGVMSKHFEGPGGAISPLIHDIVALLKKTNNKVMTETKTRRDLFYAAALDKKMDKGALVKTWTSDGLLKGNAYYVQAALKYVPKYVVFVDDTKDNLDKIVGTMSSRSTEWVTDCNFGRSPAVAPSSPYVWLVVASSRFGENCPTGQPIDCPAAVHPPKLLPLPDDPYCEATVCIDDFGGHNPKGCVEDDGRVTCNYPLFKFSDSVGKCSGRFKADDSGSCQNLPEKFRLVSSCCGLSPGHGGQWFAMLNAIVKMLKATHGANAVLEYPDVKWSGRSQFPYLTLSKFI